MAFTVESFRAALKKSEDPKFPCRCGHQSNEHRPDGGWGCFGDPCTHEDCDCWGFEELDRSALRGVIEETKCLSTLTKNSSTASGIFCGTSGRSRTTSGISLVLSAVTLEKRKSEPEVTSTDIVTP
jgi:hypothetical protein